MGPPRYRSTARGGIGAELVTDPLSTMRALAAMDEDVIVARAGGVRLWFVCDPELARELLAERADELGRNKLINRLFATISGTNLFTAEGADWRWRRQALAPAFGREQLGTGIADAIRTVEAHVERWPLDRPFDLQDATMDLALDAAISGLFGRHVTEAQRAEVRQDLATVLDWVQTRSARPLGVPLAMPTPRNRRVRRARARLRDSVATLIEPCAEHTVTRLVDHLTTVIDPETGQRIDRDSAVSEALVMLVAGHETTAAAAAWMLHHLAGDHELQHACRAEVHQRCGSERLGLQALGDLPLVSGVVTETLRLFPPAWGIPRMSSRPTSIGPHRARRFEPIVIAPAVIHRRASLFAEPDRFDPGRSDDAGSDAAPLPFGLGPRRCIGASFARAELTALAAAAVRARALVTSGTATVDPAFALRLAGVRLTASEIAAARG
ncbi:MAG: cytochrome P450 [Actinomycetota bacterium]